MKIIPNKNTSKGNNRPPKISRLFQVLPQNLFQGYVNLDNLGTSTTDIPENTPYLMLIDYFSEMLLSKYTMRSAILSAIIGS